MILSLTIWISLVIGEVFIHAEMIRRGSKPIYIQWFIIRAFVAILHGIFADVISKELSLFSMRAYWPLFFFQVTSHYLIFDLVLNWRRGLPWDYKGENSGYLDKLPLPLYYGLKVACILLLIYSLTLLF